MIIYHVKQSFPGGSYGKESACKVGEPGLIPGWRRSPGEGNGTPVFLSGEPHGQTSLQSMGSQSGMTEAFNIHHVRGLLYNQYSTCHKVQTPICKASGMTGLSWLIWDKAEYSWEGLEPGQGDLCPALRDGF